MKNPQSIAISEISLWMENHGYRRRHIFVVDNVCMHISPKISEEDLKEFKREFGHEIIMVGASFDGNGQESDFKYYSDHDALVEFRARLRDWLLNHNFPYNFTTISRGITMHCYEKLSESQIREFEEEFDVKCRKYSLKCNSNDIGYEFSWNHVFL